MTGKITSCRKKTSVMFLKSMVTVTNDERHSPKAELHPRRRFLVHQRQLPDHFLNGQDVPSTFAEATTAAAAAACVHNRQIGTLTAKELLPASSSTVINQIDTAIAKALPIGVGVIFRRRTSHFESTSQNTSKIIAEISVIPSQYPDFVRLVSLTRTTES